MIKLALSLTVFNEEYENKLIKYVIPSLLKDIKKKNMKIFFFINYHNDDILNKISKLFVREKINFKIFPKLINKKEIDNFKYKNLTKNQILHFKKSKKFKCDYIIFLYADLFYGPKSIEKSIDILSKNKSIIGCCSFAIELTENEYFEKFYNFLLKKKNIFAYDYFIDNFKKIISSFHKNYIIDLGLPTNFNFLIFYKINRFILLKTFDFHPLILRIQNNIRLIEDVPIDSEFIKNNNITKWHIEKDLHKISCFSLSNSLIQRNYFRKYNNINLNNLKLSDLFYKCIYYKINNLYKNKHDFYDSYFYLNNSIKNIDHLKINKTINLNIKKDKVSNIFHNFLSIIKLAFDIKLIKNLLMLIFLGKKKYLVYNKNFYKNERLILLKSLTTLIFNTIFNR